MLDHPPKEVLPRSTTARFLPTVAIEPLSLYSNSFSHFPLLRFWRGCGPAGLLKLSHLRMSVRILVGGHQSNVSKGRDAVLEADYAVESVYRNPAAPARKLWRQSRHRFPFHTGVPDYGLPIFACAVGKCNDFFVVAFEHRVHPDVDRERLKVFSAFSEHSCFIAPRIRGLPSTRVMFISSGSPSSGYSRGNTYFFISPIAPQAISTPEGPPPTTRNVRSSRLSAPGLCILRPVPACRGFRRGCGMPRPRFSCSRLSSPSPGMPKKLLVVLRL